MAHIFIFDIILSKQLKMTMLIILFLCSFLVKSLSAFHQVDYEVIHHRLEVVNYNRNYINNLKMSLVPVNRTVRAINSSFELLVDLTGSVPVSLEAYKLSMNDYRPFPFNLNADYCKIQKENTFGINDLGKYSNMSACPMLKGYYYVNKYRPDETKFPPHLFPGEFKALIKVKYGSDVLVESYWYGSIKPLEKLKSRA